MNIKELCEVAQVDYNSNHPSYSLNKIRQIYLLEEVGKRDYKIVRKLTKQEQITGKKLTQCKQLFIDECVVAAARVFGAVIARRTIQLLQSAHASAVTDITLGGNGFS